MRPYKTVAYYTLGCKLNFSETSTIARLFENEGIAKVDFSESADIYLINTCSVTENADKKCKQLVKKALKNNPEAYIAVIGCYAQLKPDEIAAIPGVNIVLGANEKFNILSHLDELQSKEDKKVLDGKIKEVHEFIPGYSAGDRTRTFLKIQDGCDYFCTFCTIPLARGKSRSHDIKATLKVAQEAASTEAKEIVLTGVNIGDFGVGTEETFFDLIQELDKIEGVERFRISSIEPNLLSNEIIHFVSESKKFVPHFHIPLQSGNNELLQKMRRKYLRELYHDRVHTIKNKMPDACIGVDVIVGFPGETEEKFMDTYNFLNELPISYLHVFTYSERANTGAVKMEGVVDKGERAKRSKMLHILSEKKKRAFYESQLNKSKEVLFESEDHDGYIHGFTENYLKVALPFDASLMNKIKKVQINAIDKNGMMEVAIIEEVNA